VPDAERDEVIGAQIVARRDAEVTREELLAHCRRELAAYKVPRLFRFTREDELPLTVTGKLMKNQLYRLFDGSG
jgi:fatty-acyl-CoA synthase